MLLLPANITASEATDTRRLLVQAIKSEKGGGAVLDAVNLQRFDSAALAVLLECQREAEAAGKSFELRNPPPKLTALARLYGIDSLLTASGHTDA